MYCTRLGDLPFGARGGNLRTRPEHRLPEFEPRIVFGPLAAMLLAYGAGGIAQGALNVCTVAGAAAMVVTELIGRTMADNRRLRQRVRTEGIATPDG